jgi:hypoxanthine phosphoribosyltransferase
MGEEIRKCYEGTPLVALVILKGSFIFSADLLRAVDKEDLEVDFIQLSSYRGTKSCGKVEMLMGEVSKYKNKHILILEDIVDTGLTLHTFIGYMKEAGVASVKVCSLLEKSEINKGRVAIDFLGFDIPNKFVIGYGLDLDEKYRNIPDVLIYNED